MAKTIQKVNRTTLFISHISEEAAVANVLKAMLEKDFLGLVKLFTSSEVGSIPGGDNWLDSVHGALGKAAALIVLCSKASTRRPWVQFELGGAWMREIPIIPVCHSGMKLTDLPLPLSLQQGYPLDTAQGLKGLYQAIGDIRGLEAPPPPHDIPAQLKAIADVAVRVDELPVIQFERYIDIVLPPPGLLTDPSIPAHTLVESNNESLQLFGYIRGPITWGDIVNAAQRTPDRRWLGELQDCVYRASRNDSFRPMQAVYHSMEKSYQPQLAKMEYLPAGARRFHVHLVETVVAPLFEVQNEFGLLATILRLGLRFRYEVIERYRKLLRSAKPGDVAALQAKMCSAIETIENDAQSRGAENIDAASVADLFDEEDQQDFLEIQDQWTQMRALAFRTDPPVTAAELADVISRMHMMNFRFMDMGTKRFHELVHQRWRLPSQVAGSQPRGLAAKSGA